MPHHFQYKNFLVSFLCIFLGLLSAKNVWADFFEPVNTLTELAAVDNVEGMALSPDTSHLYAGNSVIGAISAYEFNSVSGDLTYIDQYRDPLLKSVVEVKISPDGKHVYALSSENKAVFVYERDFITGTLTLNHTYESKFNPDATEDQFLDTWAMTFSPDGLHVYLASKYRVTLLSRNSITGALTEQQQISNWDGSLGNEYYLWQPSDILLSNDGQNIYVINTFPGSILIFSRDTISGELTIQDQLVHDEALYPYDFTQIPGLSSPMSMALSADDKFIYIVSLYSESIMLARDTTTGSLTFVETFQTDESLQTASDVIISNDGNYLIVSSHRNDRINIYSRDTNTGQVSLLNSYFDNQGSFTNLHGIFPLIAIPGSDYILGAAFNEDTLNTFELDELGQITQVSLLHDKDIGVEGLDSVYASEFSPDKKFLYTASLLEGAITQYSIDDVTGALTYVDAYLDTSPNYFGIESITKMKIGPDNRFLYTVSHFSDGIGVFDIDSVTGHLTQIQFIPYPFVIPGYGENLNGAENIEFSPDGKYVYMFQTRGHRVGVYKRNSITGTLIFDHEIQSSPIIDTCIMSSPIGLKFSSTNNQAYLIAQGVINLMDYNPDTGALSCLVSYHSRPLIANPNFTGIDTPVDLVFNHDESIAFVANRLSFNDGSISILNRDVITGELSFVREYKAPESFDYGLGGIFGLYLSNDERYIYSRSTASNQIAVHEYDASNQRLMFVEEIGTPTGLPFYIQEGRIQSFSFHEDKSMMYSIDYITNSVMAHDIGGQTDLIVNVESMTSPMYPEQDNSLVISVTNQGLTTISSHSVYIDLPQDVTVTPDPTIQDNCILEATRLYCHLGEITALGQSNAELTLNFNQAASYAIDVYANGSAFDTNLPNNYLNLDLVVDLSTPPIVGDDNVFATEDELIVFDELLSNDIDPDGDSLTMTLKQSDSVQGGSLSLTGYQVTYVPPENFFGSDSFVYTVSDGKGNLVQGTVSITVANVNDNPQGFDDTGTTDSETSLQLTDLLVNDIDVDTDDVLSITLTDSTSKSGGKVVLVNSTTVQYTPPSGFIGSDQFNYTLTDNHGGTSTAQVTINVTQSNNNTNQVSNETSGSGGGAMTWFMFIWCLLLISLRKKETELPPIKRTN